ncbi:MAG: hypothetical protein N2203_02695, partial [Bacteroidia bacterium]|nr:hypothetical protein [Bacteroidia bacterium]
MKLALIQTSLDWEDKQKNLEHFERIIDKSEDNIDVFILPEMFTTGFTMNTTQLAEKLNGPTTQWMLKKAYEKNACVTGSIITTDGKHYFNTLLWVYPNQSYQFYPKRHLFRMAGEH